MPVINIEDLTEKDKLKMEVDQLKKEVTLERMVMRKRTQSGPKKAAEPGWNRAKNFLQLLQKVSKCCEDVKDYIEERSGEDPLVKGIPEDKNPFKELKGGCTIS